MAHWVEGIDLAFALDQPFDEVRLDLADQVMQAGLERALAVRVRAMDDFEQVAAVVEELLQEDGTGDILADMAAQVNALHRSGQTERAEATERLLEHLAR